MEASRYLSCLRHDATRLREVASGRLNAAVPSCPDWTVADLVTHVSVVYLHKAKCIQLGEFPRPWPPDFSGEQPPALLDRSLAELLDEFDKHGPADPAKTWYAPDQSVGFWIRRMAQETVIHRVDAELVADDVTAIPNDLAVDGIDEVLSIFLGWDSLDTIGREGPDSWPALAVADGRAVEVRAGGRVWSVRPTSA
ncbi:MAG: maleylpyruvate isomerase family mycothiol-dependent enzyme, partial [Micromonosporaceae bacterium]